jgi:hypothetical protein
MKTKTSNQTTVSENTGTRKSFTKAFVLLAVMAFIGMGFKAKAQLSNSIDVDNQSSCYWDVRVYNGGTLITTLNLNPNTHPAVFCVSGNVTRIVVQDASSTCATSTFVSPWVYSLKTPSCSSPACTTGVDCSGGNPTALCTPAGDYIIVQIY